MISPTAVCRGVLVQALPNVPVSTKVPNPRPDRFIRLVRVGGPRARSVDHAMFVVECWALNPIAAEQDALAVHEALRLAPNGGPFAGGWVSRWDPMSIADYPDPEVQSARFTVTGTLHVRTF